jgi:hypothetical protein
MTRIIQIFGALLAVLAFSAVAATSAFAGDEWLVGGKVVTTSVGTVSTGKWLFLGLSFGGFVKTHIVCNGELLGTVDGLNVNGKGTDTITEIHNLALTQLKTITCEVLSGEKGPCSTTLALVTALHLPWSSELVLKTGDTKPRDLFSSGGTGEPGFEFECATSTGKFKETCEGKMETEQLKNEGSGGVGAEINNQLSKRCGSESNVLHITGSEEITVGGGLTLATS